MDGVNLIKLFSFGALGQQVKNGSGFFDRPNVTNLKLISDFF
jgi:hypothetical protein